MHESFNEERHRSKIDELFKIGLRSSPSEKLTDV